MHMHTENKAEICKLPHNITHSNRISPMYNQPTNPPILLMNFFREAGGGIFQTGSSLLAGKE